MPRIWQVKTLRDPEELVWKLTWRPWPRCQGFLLRPPSSLKLEYLFLNISPRQEEVQSYLVVSGGLEATQHRYLYTQPIRVGDEEFRAVLRGFLRMLLEPQPLEHGQVMMVVLESEQEHQERGRCPFCFGQALPSA